MVPRMAATSVPEPMGRGRPGYRGRLGRRAPAGEGDRRAVLGRTADVRRLGERAVAIAAASRGGS